MLFLKKRDYQAIVAHCRQRLPEEACGLLGGREGGGCCRVEFVFFLTNADHSSRHFSMEPKEQFAALKVMRTKGIGLVGNFHSHPDALAEPSLEDRRFACDRGFRYVILSLLQREAVLKVFLLEEAGLVEEEVILEE